MLRKESGITLVALIITIIVLIILAAVTIISVQNSGLVNFAIKGTQNYDNAQHYENAVMTNIYNLVSDTVSNIQAMQSADAAKTPGT